MNIVCYLFFKFFLTLLWWVGIDCVVATVILGINSDDDILYTLNSVGAVTLCVASIFTILWFAYFYTIIYYQKYDIIKNMLNRIYNSWLSKLYMCVNIFMVLCMITGILFITVESFNYEYYGFNFNFNNIFGWSMFFNPIAYFVLTSWITRYGLDFLDQRHNYLEINNN